MPRTRMKNEDEAQIERIFRGMRMRNEDEKRGRLGSDMRNKDEGGR